MIFSENRLPLFGIMLSFLLPPSRSGSSQELAGPF